MPAQNRAWCLFPSTICSRKVNCSRLFDISNPDFMLMDSDFEELMAKTTEGMDFVEFKITLSASPASPLISYEDLIAQGSVKEPEVEIPATTS